MSGWLSKPWGTSGMSARLYSKLRGALATLGRWEEWPVPAADAAKARSTTARWKRTRRLYKRRVMAAHRRELLRGQREAHRRGLPVREVMVWSDDHGGYKAVVGSTHLRTFGGKHDRLSADGCLYCTPGSVDCERHLPF